MALFDDVLKGNIVTTLALGVGAVILAPIVIPVLASVSKPLAKAIIKGGILVYEKGKEAVAEASEVVEDMVAEVKAEMAESQKDAAPIVTPGGETGA